jgi:2-amino-4-hydroxy-6-hydroxymethyldihydropteridine diphosphokinase
VSPEPLARTSRAEDAGTEIAHLGLGSNVGDRLGNLRRAREALGRRGMRVTASSSVYETEPIGEVTEQRDFLNACVAVETGLGPEELLAACKAVERELGRGSGGPRHGPRPIDVDVLLLGDVERHDEALTVPHPEIVERRFVLLPLLELDPGLALPDGRALAEFLPRVKDQRADRRTAL